jgi:hypothetical protein
MNSIRPARKESSPSTSVLEAPDAGDFLKNLKRYFKFFPPNCFIFALAGDTAQPLAALTGRGLRVDG